MHYVIGDIHGCYQAWIRLKNRIEKNDSDARFILVGDIIDRGPQVIKTLRWAVKNITWGGKYQMIMGNHESEKIRWIRNILKRADKDNYKKVLKEAVPDNYDFLDNIIFEDIGLDELKEYLSFFEKLSLYKEIEVEATEGIKKKFIIVHAGIQEGMLDRNDCIMPETFDKLYNCYEGYSLRMRTGREILLWSRNTDGYRGLDNTYVINGHTPTVTSMMLMAGAEPGKIFYAQNNINVDCGMVYYFFDKKVFPIAMKGNLASYCLETGAEEYAYVRR